MPLLAEASVMLGGSVALSIVAKATAVLLAVLIAARATRTIRASARHVLFVSAFGAIALLPAAAVLTPSVDIPVAMAERPLSQASFAAVPNGGFPTDLAESLRLSAPLTPPAATFTASGALFVITRTTSR